MRRIIKTLATLAAIVALPLAAQDFSALARLDPDASGVTDLRGGLRLELELSRAVPWRLATLDAPRRLVLDLRVVDWTGLDVAALDRADGVLGLRVGEGEDGWSRLVVDLGAPMAVAEAGLALDASDGSARLSLRLDPVDEAAFAVAATRLPDESPPTDAAPAGSTDDGRLVVAIDPGHGGVDPGAERGGLREAQVMLALGLELAEALARAGLTPVLTRREDVFVPLAARMTIARAARADVLISLHADALEQDAASGASVYTLTDEAADVASARMVERHERRDLLAGLDLAEADDAVATALLDLARQDTAPASRRLADALIAGLGKADARVNSRPRREAPLAVLNAADFPSALLEVGFLSDEGDRERLSSAEGRAPIVAGIVAALTAWEADEGALQVLRLR